PGGGGTRRHCPGRAGAESRPAISVPGSGEAGGGVRAVAVRSPSRTRPDVDIAGPAFSGTGQSPVSAGQSAGAARGGTGRRLSWRGSPGHVLVAVTVHRARSGAGLCSGGAASHDPPHGVVTGEPC